MSPNSKDASPSCGDGATERPPPRAPELSSQELERITIICRAIARKRIHLFHRLPSITIDDVVQAAICGASNRSIGGALRAHASYRPPHSYNSWIGQAAHAAILDLYKITSREYARANLPAPADLDYGTYPTFANTTDESLPEIPARLNRQTGARAGRIGHPPAAYMAALLYRERHGLSWQRFWLRLKHDPALVRMLGFSTCPSLRRIHAAVVRLKQWAHDERSAAD